MKKRNKRLQSAIDRIDRAEARLLELAREIQSTCKHEVVVQMPWRAGKWLGPSNARRICPRCGIEEEGSHWSGDSVWSRVDFKEPYLGNSEDRIVVEAKEDQDFYQHRLPGTPVNEPARAA